MAATLGLTTGPISHEPWVYYGFLQTYSASAWPNGLAPAWSLCVEVTFYAVLPLLALAARRWSVRKQVAAVATITLGVLAARAVSITANDPILSDTLLTTLDWFLIGMLLCAVSVLRPSMLGRLKPWIAFGAAAALFVGLAVLHAPWGSASALHPHAGPWVFQHVFYGLIAGLALAGALAAQTQGGVVYRLMASAAGRYLGRVSYGVFLWHVPVILGVSKLVAHGLYPSGLVPDLALIVGLSLTAASVSWYGLERYVMASRLVNGGKAKTQVPTTPMPALVQAESSFVGGPDAGVVSQSVV